MTRRRAALIAAVAVLVLAGVVTFVLTRPLRRRVPIRVAREIVRAPAEGIPLARLPQNQWTARLIQLEDGERWSALDDELSDLAKAQPAAYAQYQLSYLHARVKQQLEQYRAASDLFRPFLAPENPFRDLALYHMAEITAEDERTDESAGYRDELIFNEPRSPYRSEAIDEQLAYFADSGDLDRYAQFAGRLRPQADTALRRVIDAQFVELLVRRGALADAKERGIRLLKGEDGDDAAERTFRALDRPQIISAATSDELVLLGEAARAHRHFDRAVALLSMVRPRVAGQKRDDITFAIGRAHFGAEQYAPAERIYLEGAAAAKKPEMKATFYFHASRCAQLSGDDARAERHMTAAIAVPGRFPSTSAALTQRMRTRARAGRFGQAASDLRLLRQLFAQQHAVVEASLSLATSWLGRSRPADVLRELNSIPPHLMGRHDRPEVAYWRARALERSDPAKALNAYLDVLRAPVPTHFAYLARQRLGGSFKDRAAAEAARLRRLVQEALQNKEFEHARRRQTDVVLLVPNNASELELLRTIYREIPRYRDILQLTPRPFPRFPLPPGANRGDLLFAMGLFDELVDDIDDRYPLRPLDSALTAALGFNLAGASRSSLHAIEILVNNVPDDFVPELMPRLIRELLYPRYFYEFIVSDADRYDADPVLVLSIMREESRFNPRAKSVAAARGLLQFILTTALQIGRDVGITDLSAEDLYDPRVVIQLGAKYIGDLLEQFKGNGYQTAAAYNAGPHQARLWVRLAPAPGDDFYLTAINFEETKHYVRKVMNSYQRYTELYEAGGARGGMRAEP